MYHPTMLDIKQIREDPDAIRAGIAARAEDNSVVDRLLELDASRRAMLTNVEELKSKRNKASKEIGALKKQGKDTTDTQASVRDLGNQIDKIDGEIKQVDQDLRELLIRIPNLPHSSTPRGADESGNVPVCEHGEKKTFDFKPRTHIEIGEHLCLFDFQRATRMAGSGFPLLTGLGARLQRALVQFMLDLHREEHGYTEISTPILCGSKAMTGTGQLPKLDDDMYKLPGDDLYLIPTGEVPLVNIFREEIIDRPMPLYLMAHTQCFRREAGAAGKTTRGMLRLHQFEKVELVKIVHPDSSYDELESLLKNALTVVERLELNYRVLELCTGDMSFAAAKCYDVELWSPGQNDWLEVSSCSNCEAFQARRAGIRYRREDKKVDFVHTLNGSGVALPRLIVAILENGQQADGTVKLPAVLVPYMNGIEKLELPSA